MRKYRPINLGAFSDSPELQKELGHVDQYLRQMSSVFTNLINPGVMPGPKIGGDSRIPGRDNPLDDYFYKPGVAGGQVAYGDKNASGTLTLSSTRSGTKGTIYWGAAEASVYDEFNDRLGVKTAAPAASLHVKGEAPGNVYWRPSATPASGGFVVAGAATGHEALDEAVADDLTTYISAITNNPNYTCTLAGSGTIPATTGWTFRFRAYRVLGTAVTYNWAIKTQGGATVRSGTGEVSPAGFTTVEVALTAGECGTLSNSGLNSTMQFTVDGFTGLTSTFADNQWRMTWVECQIPTSSAGAGVGGNTALFDAHASQSVDNTQWRSSAGTVYISISAAGRLTVESGGSMRFVPGAGADKIMQSNASGDLSLVTVGGDVTQTGGTFTIGNDKVTYAKMQNVSAASRLLGRGSAAGAGDPEEIILGTNLSMSGTTLNAAGGAEVENLWIYGDGSDGNFTLDGANTYASYMSKSGNDYFLFRDLYADNLTINSGCTLETGGWRIFVKGTLTNAGTIYRLAAAGGNGGNAAGAGTPAGGTAGTAVTSDGTYPLGGSTAGTAGRQGQVGAGSAATGVPVSSVGEGGSGGGGGRGEDSVLGGAGGAATSGTAVTQRKWRTVGTVIALNFIYLIEGGTGGRGGSSGSGDGASRGAGGGGGGAGGGVVGIWARYVVNTGTIHADGGAGGNGGNTDTFGGAGGGGGGGGGGYVYIIYDTITVGTIRAAGGAAGAVGTLGTGGTAGTAGTAGSAGTVLKYCRITGLYS